MWQEWNYLKLCLVDLCRKRRQVWKCFRGGIEISDMWISVKNSMAVLRHCLSSLKPLPNKTHLPTIVAHSRVFLQQPPLLFICLKPHSAKARAKDTSSVQDNSSDINRSQIDRASNGPPQSRAPFPIGPEGPNLDQLSEPPVLFIGKYQRAIDTRELELRDELSDIAKKGKMTPESLTQQKVCHKSWYPVG